MNSQLLLIGLFLGVLLLITHLLTLFVPKIAKERMLSFPRSRPWGIVLLAISTAWTFLLIATTDLGEFSPWRTMLLLGTVVGSILFGWLVPEFLAVRSLGFILLLAARSLLEITFLQSTLLSRLITILTYTWIISGFFMVGMPYLLRNLIAFLAAPKQKKLFKFLSWIGVLYGLVLLINAIWLFWL